MRRGEHLRFFDNPPHHVPEDELVERQHHVPIRIAEQTSRFEERRLPQRRAACGYRFEGGRICFISGVGRVLWAEDLSALERLEPGPARQHGPDYLLLHWSGRTRRVDLLGAMKVALAASAV